MPRTRIIPAKWVVHLEDSSWAFPSAISTLEFGKFCAVCVCFCVFPRMFLGSISFPSKDDSLPTDPSKQARYKLSEAEPLFSRALEGRKESWE